MQQRNFQQKVGQFSKLSTIAGIVLLGALTACGGGGDSSGGDKRSDNTKPVTPVQGSTNFTRMGIDVAADGAVISGNLGATLDASASITFTSPAQTDPASSYNFTFGSGLPGGFVSSNIFTMGLGSANKNVTLLFPKVTQQVQNVFWTDKNNAGRFGMAVAGHVVQPNTVAWPASGTATYKGGAFQYVTFRAADASGSNDYALYLSDVTATVDYSAKTIAFEFAANPIYREGTNKSLFQDLAPEQTGMNIEAGDIDFTGNSFNYTFTSPQKSWVGLGLTNENTLNFFGANGQELAGTVHYSSKALSEEDAAAFSRVATQTVSFALVKQ